MAQRREDATGEHDGVRVGERRQGVARDEEDHEGEEHLAARQPGHRGGEPERPDGHGQCVAGDEPAGGGLVDGEIRCYLRQQARDDELREADAETADREGDEPRGDASGRRPVSGFKSR